MSNIDDPFAVLMNLAHGKQRHFTTKLAIEAGYADHTHLFHDRAGNCHPLGGLCDLSEANPESVGSLRPVPVEARRNAFSVKKLP